jgi:hypothetical protein
MRWLRISCCLSWPAVAQQERLTISERTLAGLRRARKAGKVLGRPSADVDMAKVEKRRAQGESLRLIASDLGVSAALQVAVDTATRDGFWNAKRFLGLAGVYWEWSKKKRKFVILCGVTGTILYYPRPPQ